MKTSDNISFLLLLFFNWRIIVLQCCIGFCYTTWINHNYIFVYIYIYTHILTPSSSFLVSWFFASGGQSIRDSASVLPMNIQGWFPSGLTDLISWQSKGLSKVFSSTTVWTPSVLMNIQGWFSLGLTGLISLQSKRLSKVFSSTTVWKNQFFDAQPSLWSNSHIHTWLLEKT